MTVAAFSAIASTPHTYNGERVTPEALALPCAVLVHAGHDVEAAAAGPVAVALPRYVAGVVRVDAVFASFPWARAEADAVRRGERSVSIVAGGGYGSASEYRYGVLVAVDLVPVAADPGARITATLDAADLTPELRRSQVALDAYLADLANPQQLDLLARLSQFGVRAFDPLAPLVAGIRAHHEARARRRALDRAEVAAMLRSRRRSVLA